MEYEAVMAAIQDGGGFNNVARLIFDNNIHINFSGPNGNQKLKESDFVNLGGTWFYKELFMMRNGKTYEYDVPMVTYHPFECMQAIIMSAESNRIDALGVYDMLAQNSATG